MRHSSSATCAVALFGLLAVAAPANAQSKMPRVGMLLTGSPSSGTSAPEVDAFVKQLTELGWVDGKNLVLEQRWAERVDRFPELAAELVRSRASVILAPGPEATRAATAATSTTPIVMIASADPRRVGVSSLARPGGNLTGLTIGPVEVVFEKRLELLKQAIPGLSRVAILWDVNRATELGDRAAVIDGPARALGLQLQQVDVKSVRDFEPAFKAAKAGRAGAVLLVEGPRAVAKRDLIAELGLKHRLPLMGHFRPIVQAGGLMSYGVDLNDLFRRAAGYVDKILKGAKPADLPVEQPTKFQLVVNLKTAKALGITLPPSVLSRADEVIE
jgi:putative ABC transport system substrate-binding protein